MTIKSRYDAFTVSQQLPNGKQIKYLTESGQAMVATADGGEIVVEYFGKESHITMNQTRTNFGDIMFIYRKQINKQIKYL